MNILSLCLAALCCVVVSCNILAIKSVVDDCSSVLIEQKSVGGNPSDKSDFIETFGDLEFDLQVQGRMNLSVPDCSGPSPYYLKDFCIFDCPFLAKHGGKFSRVAAITEFLQLTKSMQKVASITPRHNHRIAVITSSFGAVPGKHFFDVQDSTKSVDRYDMKGDLTHLPNIVANYRFIIIDIQQNTVCAHLLVQLIYFSKRTVLLPSTNPALVKHSEVAPFVVALSENRITNATFSYLFRNAAETHFQSMSSYRFALNFLTLKRRCSNINYYYNHLLNISSDGTASTTGQPTASLQLNSSLTVPVASLLRSSRGHQSRLNRHSRLRTNRGSGSTNANEVSDGGRGSDASSFAAHGGGVALTEKVVVVLSHLEGDFSTLNVSWLTGIDHVVMDRTNTARKATHSSSNTAAAATEHQMQVVDVDNRKFLGGHVSDYLRFIIARYNNLPDTMVFASSPRVSSSTGEQWGYNTDELHNDVYYLVDELKELRLENNGFAFLDDRCMRIFENATLDVQTTLHKYFAQWLEFPMNRFTSPTNAFAVTKTAVLRRSVDSYMTLLRLVDYQVAAVEVQLMDLAWPAVFRSSCIVGNYDDCFLRRLHTCGVGGNEFVAEATIISRS